MLDTIVRHVLIDRPLVSPPNIAYTGDIGDVGRHKACFRLRFI